MKNLIAVYLVCLLSPSALPEGDGVAVSFNGRMAGAEIVFERAEFYDSYLSIQCRTKDGYDLRIGLRLPIEIGVIPERKQFSNDQAESARESVRVVYRCNDPDLDAQNSQEMKIGEYEIEIQFGTETDKGLPVRISLSNPQSDIEFEGNFSAEVKGLRLVDGHPDLQCDHRETLTYAGQLYLQKQPGLESAQITRVRDCKYTIKPEVLQTGWLEGEYQIGQGEPNYLRLQFVKDENGWRVYRQLRADQLIEAHPIEPPEISSAEGENGEIDTTVFYYLAFQALEASVQKEFPGRGFSARRSAGLGINPNTGIGFCGVKYSLHGSEEWFTKRYLFRKTDGLWGIERMLEEGEQVDTKTGRVEKRISTYGKTLCEAVEEADAALVRSILGKGANVNAADRKDVPPLVSAAAGGFTEITDLLLKAGARPEDTDKGGRRALYLASARGDLEIVQLLIRHGANVNIRNPHGSTALHSAAVWDRPEVAEILIDAGADVNALDEGGRSPLDLAIWWQSERTAAILQKAGGEGQKATEQPPGLMGRVYGAEIVGGQAVIDSGKFVCFYGKEGRIAPKVTVILSIPSGILPEHKSFIVRREDTKKSGLVGIMFEHRKDRSEPGSVEHIYTGTYDLNLTFDQEQEGILSGQVQLDCPAQDVRLKGTFKAEVIGKPIGDDSSG